MSIGVPKDTWPEESSLDDSAISNSLSYEEYAEFHLAVIEAQPSVDNPKDRLNELIEQALSEQLSDAVPFCECICGLLGRLYTIFCKEQEAAGIDGTYCPRGWESALFEVNVKEPAAVSEKLYRINVSRNPHFSDQTPIEDRHPDGGWVSSGNLSETMDDLIRSEVTLTSVRAVDGFSHYVANTLPRYVYGVDLLQTKEHESFNRGLFANHVYFRIQPPGSTNAALFELQVFSATQAVWRPLAHKVWESQRIGRIEDDNPLVKMVANVGASLRLADEMMDTLEQFGR